VARQQLGHFLRTVTTTTVCNVSVGKMPPNTLTRHTRHLSRFLRSDLVVRAQR
jgi:hypothetical protein